ncbi:replication initiator [Streptomyces sp. PpalLS-921]|uniref:replication initiator n=1 Tax=Streptomyces sp. PpalLS-921 TaxID=1839772 RepID=UPI00351F7F22
MPVPTYGNHPAREPRWGAQVDVRPIGADSANDDLAEEAVASCVAKYATKAAETTGTVDRRIGDLARQAHRPIRPGPSPDRSLLRL